MLYLELEFNNTGLTVVINLDIVLLCHSDIIDSFCMGLLIGSLHSLAFTECAAYFYTHFILILSQIQCKWSVLWVLEMLVHFIYEYSEFVSAHGVECFVSLPKGSDSNCKFGMKCSTREHPKWERNNFPVVVLQPVDFVRQLFHQSSD